MTPVLFESYWHSNYPDSVPLVHLFKFYFKHRCFRINSPYESLPHFITESKRNKLIRIQNDIITDMVGDNCHLWGVTGEYDTVDNSEKPKFLTKGLLSKFSFTELASIDMRKVSLTEFAEGEVYRLFITELVWQSDKFNDLLEAIATDEARMFFISVTPKCLIAPHDGGIDFVMETYENRNTYESKYKSWMSDKIKSL